MAVKKKNQFVKATFLDDDGKELEGQLSLRIPTGPKLFNWIHAFECGLTRLANMNLRKSEASLVFFILGTCTWKNEWIPDKTLIWATCGIYKEHQPRIIRQLIEKEIIFEIEPLGIQPVFMLNPLLGWKGSAQEYYTENRLRLVGEEFKWGELSDRRPKLDELPVLPPS